MMLDFEKHMYKNVMCDAIVYMCMIKPRLCGLVKTRQNRSSPHHMMIDYGCYWNCSDISTPPGETGLLCHSDAMTTIQMSRRFFK